MMEATDTTPILADRTSLLSERELELTQDAFQALQSAQALQGALEQQKATETKNASGLEANNGTVLLCD